MKEINKKLYKCVCQCGTVWVEKKHFLGICFKCGKYIMPTVDE